MFIGLKTTPGNSVSKATILWVIPAILMRSNSFKRLCFHTCLTTIEGRETLSILYFDIKVSQDLEQERTEIEQTIYLRLFISTIEEWRCCEVLDLRIGIGEGNLNKAVVQIWVVTVGLVFGFARDNFYSQMCHLDLPKQSRKSQVTTHPLKSKSKTTNTMSKVSFLSP